MWIAILTPVLIALGAGALWLAAALVFAETGLLAGFFLPGDSLLLTTGILVASGTLALPLWLVCTVLVLAAVAGDSAGYQIGRRYGPRLFSSQRRFPNTRHLAAATDFVAKYGPTAVIAARFIPWARTFVPVVAGTTSMSRRHFAATNVTGALVWVAGLCTTGYALGQIEWVAEHVTWITIATAVAAIAPVAAINVSARVRAGRRSSSTAGEDCASAEATAVEAAAALGGVLPPR